jgi:hypothetical protein
VTPGNKENTVDIKQNYQPHKSSGVDASRSDWRRFERRLVEFFRSNGIAIEHDGGEAYIGASTPRAKRSRFVDVVDVSLSDLARILVEAVS